MAAIRFKWTVRLDNGDYYVDETIGENSSPLVTGPLDRDAAIRLVDERESEARRRFEQLKSEMTGRGDAANLVRKESSEAYRRCASWRHLGGPRKSFLASSTPAWRRMS